MTYTTQYDSLIQIAMQDHLPMLDWRWGRAQLIAESGLDPTAVSPAGALGLAQFMPNTWGMDVCSHFMWNPETVLPETPSYAIPAFAWYMRRQWDAWSAPRTPSDRLRLAQASYNAGLGNILKAQRAAGIGLLSPPNDYDSIIAALPQVTGAKAAETIGYVQRIGRIYEELASGVTA